MPVLRGAPMTRLRARELCKYVRHYAAKNGFAIRIGMLGRTLDEERLLESHGYVEILPLYEGGPKVGIVLTNKGFALTEEAVRVRRKR